MEIMSPAKWLAFPEMLVTTLDMLIFHAVQ